MRNRFRRDLIHTQTVQAGHSEERRRRHTVFQLAQTGLHIAAEFHDLQIGPEMQQLRPTP